MTSTATTTGNLLTGEQTTTSDGETAYRVPLSGRDGAGKFALVDAEGLERLRQAGARYLYLVGDGHQNRYVTFLRTPSHHCAMAARAVIKAPNGRRVIYRNGDRLDLRASNLMIQPRKDEAPSKVTGEKSHAINQGWQAHHSRCLRERADWKRAARPTGDRRPW